MPKCGSNTLIMGTPSRNAASRAGCATGCNDGVGSCPPGIGPRKEREKTREKIKDYVLLMLGAPAIKIELDSQQLDLAVDQSLSIIEDYAPRDYFDYYNFPVVPGKTVYKMPPDVGVIRNVFYKQVPSSGFNSYSSDLDGVMPLDYYYGGGGTSSGMSPQAPAWGHMGEWVLYKQYEQMYSNVTGQKGGWEWVSDHQHIKIYPGGGGYCSGGGMASVHYLQKCKDWNEVTQAMKEGALAYAKIMLGRIRSRYRGSFGPSNSGMQFDGEALLQEGMEEKTKWMEDLIYKFGDLPYISMA